jgi:chromosomal replication initiator protein
VFVGCLHVDNYADTMQIPYKSGKKPIKNRGYPPVSSNKKKISAMNNQQLWQAILGNLEVTLSKANFNTWFKNTAIVERGEDFIIIGVPSAFSRDWISTKYQTDIAKVLKTIAPEIREIKYQVGLQKAVPVVAQGIKNQPSVSYSPQTRIPSQQYAPAQPAPTNSLNTKYIFDSFVIGKHNELAHAAAQAVSKNPGSQYNPLFIYGGVGLGKTHLMHAVGNKLLAERSGYKVLYVTSEKFTNDYIQAIGSKRMDEFKKMYRTVDMLLIDDIQFIAGKEGTQEEFFHTFNELRDKGRQIIMTADRLPKDIPAIESRLVSRFEWGMVADIQAPDFETRLAILNTKVAKKGITLNEDIVYFIAENIVSNIRELEGALNRLLVYQQMESKHLTIEHARNILGNMIAQKKKITTLKKIAMSVAEFYNITVEDLIKQSRRKEYVKPRQIAMYVSRKELGSSFPTIGEFYGGRDHTTVMHGVEKIENLLAQTESLKQEVDLILDKLYIT